MLAQLEAVELHVGFAAHDRVQPSARHLVGHGHDRDLDHRRVLLNRLLDHLRG